MCALLQNPDLESEIFVDINLIHYPLRDYRNIWSEMNNILKDYEKIGKRNKKKDDDHLNKHAFIKSINGGICFIVYILLIFCHSN